MLSRDRLLRLLPPLLILAGLAAIGAAFAADLIGAGSESGFGVNQMRALMLGLALIVAGSFVAWTRPRGGMLAVTTEFWRTAPRLGTAQLLLWVVWLGLAAGVVEVGHVLLRKYGMGVAMKQPLDIVWMVPLSYTLLAIAPAVLAVILNAIIPRGLPVPVATLPLIFYVANAELQVYPFDGRARNGLALVIALIVSRWCHEHGSAVRTLTRRTLLPLVVLVALVGAAVQVVPGMRERGAMAALSTARAEAPDVLFVVLDTVRADHLSSYGYRRTTTPNMDALAGRGALFEEFIATAPWTLPSHASMFTGRYHHEFNADWLVPLDDEHPTLAEAFAGAGYATGGFVGNLRFCAAEWGIDRGFAHYEDFYLDPAVIGFSSIIGKKLLGQFLGNPFHELVRNNADVVSGRFVQWLDGIGDRPFFAFLNYYDAHALYLTRPDFQTAFGDEVPFLRDWHDPKRKWNDEQMQGFVDAYDGCLHYIDHEFGALLEQLRERGRLDNTLIVVVGDHGELFGEHGLTDHGNSLYRPLLEVPLILSFPGAIPPGLRIERPVSMRDLATTVLDLAGATPTAPFPGHSLTPLLSGAASTPKTPLSPLIAEIKQGINTPPEQLNSAGTMWTLFLDGMQYIRDGDGTEHLYDTAETPEQERDLADTPEGAALIEKMRAFR